MSGFYLHYQPIFFLHDMGRMLGYEALLRHPAGWTPRDLLREARRIGAIPMWELRVLERAADEMLLRVPDMLFFNVTPEAFADPGFLVRAGRVLGRRGVSPTRVCIEISEENLYALEGFGAALEAWIGSGFFVALDDFGTRGANLDVVLSARSEFVRLDYVKMDRMLVDGVSRDRQKQRLLAGLVEALAGDGIYPILEGLEREEDLEWLAEKGWDVGVQGFAVSRPGPLILEERGCRNAEEAGD